MQQRTMRPDVVEHLLILIDIQSRVRDRDSQRVAEVSVAVQKRPAVHIVRIEQVEYSFRRHHG